MTPHQRNNRRTGVKTFEQSVEDFWSNVDSSNLGNPLLCWNWVGYFTTRNYGQLNFQGRKMRAHRASWVVHNGAIPEGLSVCHRCDNPSCVNPNHLFLGTQLDNMADAAAKKRFPDRKGVKCNSSKLIDADIPQIFQLHKQGEVPRKIAFRYSVGRATIQRVLSRKAWSHVPL